MRFDSTKPARRWCERSLRRGLPAAALVAALVAVGGAAELRAAEPQCAIATVHPLATEAGAAAFRRGGNAVDAAVAAAVTLGVVDNYNSGLGGGCFVLIRSADGQLAAIDGREKAPAAATADMFLRDGVAVPELSQTGPLASGVPGALAAYELALQKYGQLPLSDVVTPAAEIAEHGFPVPATYARNLKGLAKTLRRFPGSRAALLKPDGQPYAEGEILRQPDLAASYRAIAADGSEWFYHGEFAARVGNWMAENGGLITADDFADYEAVQREPIITKYREFTVVGFPPPSSGGVHVAQMLNILEHFDLQAEHERDPARARHIIIEAMKLAFADRAYWLGDSDFVSVPRGLIDRQYAAELAAKIDPTASTAVASHGEPPRAQYDTFGRHTTHIAAADSEGNWVAITATVNTTFGSKVIVPGTGIVLNNEMDDFSAQPGVPNAFGLIGAENNAVAPGKRPLSSMSPTIVLKGDEPVLTVGAAGGPKIITQALLAIIRRLDYGESLADAVAGPRFHHQWSPDQVVVEEALGDEAIEQLQAYGHQVDVITHGGVTQAAEIDQHGKLHAVHDPRAGGTSTTVTREPALVE
ncbi:MAG: gamma-glutamyltransferase [Planctomycetales bacterium]|nr:gamma-glutamyltransferase [Planctomycetales bacterium]